MMGERCIGTGNKRQVGQRRRRGKEKNIVSGYHCLKDIKAIKENHHCLPP